LWLKRATILPHPLHSPVRGDGEGGCYLYGPEDLLNKNVSYTYIIIKSILKMPFLMKTSESFSEALLVLKKYFA
jgi:hypothetical protein